MKVPAATVMEKGTTLILSSDRSRVLMVHTADDFKFVAKHRVAILETRQLRTVAELPLGKCRHDGGPFPLAAEHLTMVCYHSRPPAEGSRTPTLALVTVDINRGEVVRWFPLGGERRGIWFGPMFFGWTYDVRTIEVRRKPACPFVVDLSEPAPERIEDPDLVLVLNTSKGPHKGEVWFASKRYTEPPTRMAILPSTPGSAVMCRSNGPVGSPDRLLLYVTAPPDPKADSRGGPAPDRVDVIDLANGRVIGP